MSGHVQSRTVAVAGAVAAAAAVLWYLAKKRKASYLNKVAILDAGAQYGKLIDRRVRECKVESIVLPLSTPAAELKGKYGAIIISGGPGSCYTPDAPAFDKEVLDLGIPIFGVCYGYQLLNFAKGGVVEAAEKREDLQENITVEVKDCKLFAGMKGEQRALLTHGDAVKRIAPGFRAVSWNTEGKVVAIANDEANLFGVQFHPEVDLTEKGMEMFNNFLFNIAGLSPTYTPKSRHQAALDEIRGIVGQKEVLVLVSGGVDSSVCAALCKEALGEKRVHAVHVDHGFMRKNESELVEEALGGQGIKLHMARVAKEFAEAYTTVKGKTVGPLGKTISPEAKRMIIGDTFMRITDDAIAKLKINPDDVFLAQGTLRPDLIESGSHIASAKADVIKTHHNDTALVRKLRDEGKIVEPLKDYHKDEVRALGKELGLPHELVWRQPFPGPGLAIRVLCSDGTAPDPLSAKELDAVTQVAKASYSAASLSVCELPVRSVGVQGDCRSYKAALALTLPTETPVKDMDWSALFAIARRIPSDIPGVSRTCFMWGPPISSSDPATRQVAATCCTQDVMEQLREADSIVTSTMIKYQLEYKISQMPVILMPATFGDAAKRSVVLRPFITRDFMTGKPAVPGDELPFEALEEMVRGIRALPHVARVCYDLTAKPPGTTEWE